MDRQRRFFLLLSRVVVVVFIFCRRRRRWLDVVFILFGAFRLILDANVHSNNNVLYTVPHVPQMEITNDDDEYGATAIQYRGRGLLTLLAVCGSDNTKWFVGPNFICLWPFAGACVCILQFYSSFVRSFRVSFFLVSLAFEFWSDRACCLVCVFACAAYTIIQRIEWEIYSTIWRLGLFPFYRKRRIRFQLPIVQHSHTHTMLTLSHWSVCPSCPLFRFCSAFECFCVFCFAIDRRTRNMNCSTKPRSL